MSLLLEGESGEIRGGREGWQERVTRRWMNIRYRETRGEEESEIHRGDGRKGGREQSKMIDR